MVDTGQYLRQSSQRETNRAAAVDAGRDLFYAHGYGGTSLAMIAERARISTATLFKHFPTKAQVLAAVVEREWSAVDVDLSAATARDGMLDDLSAGLTAIGHAFVGFLRKPGTTDLFRLIIAEVPNVPELAQLGSFVDGRFYSLARDFLSGTALGAEVDAAVREDVARRFIGLLAGQVLWPALMDASRTPAESGGDQVVEAAVRVTLSGLAAAPRESRPTDSSSAAAP